MNFEYSIDYAYDAAGIGIDKDGARYDSIPVHGSPGQVSYTFTETGTYCVITEGRNSEGYACCDGIWITVVDDNVPPQNVTISSDKKILQANETIKINYSIDYAYNSAYVIIEKNGDVYHKFPINHSPGTVDFTFTELGDYTVYVEGSNNNGYSKSEEIIIHVITLGDCNGDGEFNVSDVVLLQKWLLAVPDTHFANWQAADMCEDGKLNVFDLCLMKRKLING